MIAPTIGPLVGGYLTQNYSWNWIFLINILPGLLVCLVVGACVRVGAADLSALKKLDYATLILAAIFLATLELLLNEAPGRDWHGAFVSPPLAICVVAGAAGVWRALTHATPFVDLRRFRHRAFALGCGLSFVFGMGLYGSVYMLALFLGLVRGHTPAGDRRDHDGLRRGPTGDGAGGGAAGNAHESRLLTAIGFVLFGAGLLANGFVTPQSDFWDLFWPQILRGVGGDAVHPARHPPGAGRLGGAGRSPTPAACST